MLVSRMFIDGDVDIFITIRECAALMMLMPRLSNCDEVATYLGEEGKERHERTWKGEIFAGTDLLLKASELKLEPSDVTPPRSFPARTRLATRDGLFLVDAPSYEHLFQPFRFQNWCY